MRLERNHPGAAIHFVDMSDHFQHTDHSITQINFLRYSEAEWHQIAGNEFAYCNRLRASDYLRLFDPKGFVVERRETVLDDESLTEVKSGKLKLDYDFSHRSISYGKPGISKAIIDKQESIVYVHNLNPG
jgi:hypothetical protein